MKNLSALFVPAFVVVAACGGSEGDSHRVGNKEDAAQAAYSMQRTGESLKGRSAQGLTAAQYAGQDLPGVGGGDGVSATQTVTLTGKEGSAKITNKASVTPGSVEAEYTIEYVRYSTDGLTFIDGTISHIAKVDHASSSLNVVNQIKGSAWLSGATTATLELDVSNEVKIDGGSTSVVISGSVRADGTDYIFDGDALDLVDEVY